MKETHLPPLRKWRKKMIGEWNVLLVPFDGENPEND
jgi:hypothetical protein